MSSLLSSRVRAKKPRSGHQTPLSRCPCRGTQKKGARKRPLLQFQSFPIPPKEAENVGTNIIKDTGAFGNGFFVNPGHNNARTKKEGNKMDTKHTMRNIGIGMAAGAALGMLLAPQKKTLKATAKKAVRAAEDVAENMSQRLGM